MANTVIESGARDDLVAAHREAIEAVGAAGTWWTARERVAIAVEVRRAMEHGELPPWEPPSAIEGLIPPDHPLPPAAVDATWRLTNHPGTLTREWYAAVVDGLASPFHYVELVGLVAVMNALDRFAMALSLDVLPLPAPAAQRPTLQSDTDAEVTTHWVPTRPIKGPNVLKALSAVPAANAARGMLSDAQYVPGEALLGDLDWHRGTLDRRQIELLAARTSLANDCFY